MSTVRLEGYKLCITVQKAFSSCGRYVWYWTSFSFNKWTVVWYASGFLVYIFKTLIGGLKIKFSDSIKTN